MNPYDVLGVPPDAPDEEIAKAYKRLAKRYHPDLHPGNAAAAEQMGRINRAYDDIKTMRQQGRTYQDPAAGGPFDPFSAGRTYTYTYTYTYRRRSPIGAIIAVVVVFFLMRLVLSLLFGSYARQYTVPGYYSYYPAYGYYQTVPGDR